MATASRRYRAFISYSQKDRTVARRLHRALETYRVPDGVMAATGPDRRLGRFFRDDDEMGASQSLGAALEGALDDAEALIVLCSPSSARSTWVDAEVRHFKSRGDRQVYAVILSGEPHASDPDRECFPPSLKVRIGPDGQSTGEADEPRAPDFQRDGMPRVVAQLAAGLLGVPFDDLWQRDRRRAKRRVIGWSAAGALGAAVLAFTGIGWLGAQRESRMQSARQDVATARNEAAEGRIAEALRRLAPHLEHRDSRPLVEGPVRTLLAWAPDPGAQLANGALRAVRLRDATVLLEPGAGAYDISDVGLDLHRLIRSRDGRRIIAIGDQRVVVFDASSRERVAQLDNGQVDWIGHAFEAPSGLIVVTGAVLGPTNGSVWPYVLAVSADGRSVASHAIDAHMFWDSVTGIATDCSVLMQATMQDSGVWQVEARTLGAQGLGPPRRLGTGRADDDTDEGGVALLSRAGPAFVTRDAFMGEAPQNPFAAEDCSTLGADEGAPSGGMNRTGVALLDLGLATEPATGWSLEPETEGTKPGSAPFTDCTSARPCVVIGARQGETFIRNDLPGSSYDSAGWLPQGRWSQPGTDALPVFFEHLVFNSGHQLALCADRGGGAQCVVQTALGEDHAERPLLRSVDGKYLFWPFGGVVFDLEALRPLTEPRAIPLPFGPQYDFEADRSGLTIAVDGRLVSYLPSQDGAVWVRLDDERASVPFGVLEENRDQPALLELASLGARQYLVARAEGVLARLDAGRGEEIWRVRVAGLVPLRAVELDSSRRYALLMAQGGWRLFMLENGFPVSGLLVPPGMNVADGGECTLAQPLGPDGEVVARCGSALQTWRPREFEGDIAESIARLTCAADVGPSALETIRRCYGG